MHIITLYMNQNIADQVRLPVSSGNTDRTIRSTSISIDEMPRGNDVGSAGDGVQSCFQWTCLARTAPVSGNDGLQRLLHLRERGTLDLHVTQRGQASV